MCILLPFAVLWRAAYAPFRNVPSPASHLVRMRIVVEHARKLLGYKNYANPMAAASRPAPLFVHWSDKSFIVTFTSPEHVPGSYRSDAGLTVLLA